MAVKSQIRGTQLDLYYASGFKEHTITGANGQVAVVVADASTGVFGGSKIDLRNTGLGPKTVAYTGLDNWALATGAISILARVVPPFSGTPTGPSAILNLESGTDRYNGVVIFGFNADGTAHVLMGDQFGSIICNFNTAGVITFAAGQPFDLWVTWDGSTTANKIQIWYAPIGQAATVLGSTTASVAVTSRARPSCAGFELGSGSQLGDNNIYLNELTVFDTEESPASYGARTDFIPTSPFEGYAHTDPGVGNVLAPNTYVFEGVTKTGTFSPPADSDVRQGVGSGTCIVPSPYDVRFGTNVDHTTGLVYVPSAANTRLGVVVDQSTGTAIIPSLADTKVGVSGDGGTGTYDGSDRWTSPAASQLQYGVQLKSNSTSLNLTGTLNVVANTLTQLTLEARYQDSDSSGVVISQGDIASFIMLAKGDTSLKANLTSGVFESYIKTATGVLTIPNSQHTADTDQTTNTGKFYMSMTSTQTAGIPVANKKDIVTKVTLGSDVLYFHGKGVLTVLANQPQV